MSSNISCNTSSLNSYIPSASKPWDMKRANHVYRRLAFGADLKELNKALAMEPQVLINSLVDNAKVLPVTDAPDWANKTRQDYIDEGKDFGEENGNNKREWRVQGVNDLLSDDLRGRLTLFWHNHFVTELGVYSCSNYLYNYYNILQTHALGNFKDFVRAIGISDAMLIYLNGFENTANEPNENYARELYELFTLGVDNGYTQADIVETSKALTGYNRKTDGFCSPIYFNNNTFNSDPKTIFGKTGNWDYDDVIDILFEEKAPLIAKFICTKIYKYFVSPVINESIIDDLASVFVIDFEISTVLKRLFKSEHFFDDEAIGTIIKSPYDVTHNYMKVTNFTIKEENKITVYSLNRIAGQELFNPVDVAGWQGDRDWINSSTLGGRWQGLEFFIQHTWRNYREELRDFAIDSSSSSNDPAIVTKSIIDRFVPKELHTQTDYDIATDIFKGDIPQNYYDDGIWNLNWDEVPSQVVLLLLHVTKIPEFQLK